MRLELSPEDLAGIARDLAPQLVELMQGDSGSAPTSPWMRKPEAVLYTRLGRSTFEKMAADGRIPSHGPGRAKLYHRSELDEAIRRLADDAGYAPAPSSGKAAA